MSNLEYRLCRKLQLSNRRVLARLIQAMVFTHVCSGGFLI